MTDYITSTALKASLNIVAQTYADADIAMAITAASRGLEDAYNTYWLSPAASGVRYYTRASDRVVNLADVQTISEVALDYAALEDVYYNSPDYFSTDVGPGSFATIIDQTQYRLLPIQNGPTASPNNGNGEPYKQLQLIRGSRSLRLPPGRDAIRITGTFGWESVPAGVKAATTILAARLLRRTREAPFGIIAVGAEGAAIRARDIANDPDIRFAMNPLSSAKKLFV